VPGTREWVVSGTPYFIPCRVHGDRVELRRVFHAGRKGPTGFAPTRQPIMQEKNKICGAVDTCAAFCFAD
jgi:hypothetical protein